MGLYPKPKLFISFACPNSSVLSFCRKRKNQRKAAGKEKLMVLFRTDPPEQGPKTINSPPFPVFPSRRYLGNLIKYL
jgi:hypothetical protein